MKKIAFFIPLLLVMVLYESKGNAEDIPQDLRVFKAAQVAQKMNNLDHSLVLILLLVTLVFVLIFSIVLYQFIRRLIRLGRAYRKYISSTWNDDPDMQSRKAEEPDFSLGMFTEQQWLMNQLLSLGHEDGATNDSVDLPHDWWS
jgi:hypothetical protein